MIDVNANVKLNGVISEIGTGSFKISVNEFFVDGQWNRFKEPSVIEVTSADYDNHLTSNELSFLLEAAKKAKQTNLCDDDKEVVESIIKKLSA